MVYRAYLNSYESSPQTDLRRFKVTIGTMMKLPLLILVESTASQMACVAGVVEAQAHLMLS